MDFSKLTQNEKLAVYGSAAVIVGGLVGYSYGLNVLAVLAAIAMLAIVLLPQLSSGTTLPGSHGSLMVAVGGVAAVVLLLGFLVSVGTIFDRFNVRDLFFLIAVAGGVLMAWAGWRELQTEGGKFQVGTGGSASPPADPAPQTDSATPHTESAPPPATAADDEPEHRPEA